VPERGDSVIDVGTVVCDAAGGALAAPARPGDPSARGGGLEALEGELVADDSRRPRLPNAR
jgi:hypothetical protein